MIHDYLKIDFKADCFIKYSMPEVQNWFNFENPSHISPNFWQAFKTGYIYPTWEFDQIERQKVLISPNLCQADIFIQLEYLIK